MVVYGDSGSWRGSGLTVSLVEGTARYPRTAKFLQFGGRFDSERVALARIHILLCGWRLCGAVCACGLEAKVAVETCRGVATVQAVWRCAGFVQLLQADVTGRARGLVDFA